MTKSNRKKEQQLGMPQGTANGRLHKQYEFYLLKKLNENVCCRCGEYIETVDEYSLDHKIPYLDSEDPIKLFFDLENCKPSHLRCNIGAARRQKRSVLHGTYGMYNKHKCRCSKCKKANMNRGRRERNRDRIGYVPAS